MKSHLWLTNTIILSLLHDVSSSSLTAWTMLSVGPPPPLYETCVQALKDALIPGNPPFIRPVPRHSDPNDGLFKNTRMVQVDDSPSAHLLAALNVALPSTTATFAPLSPHIQAAIRFALAQGSSLTNWRERQNHILTTVSEALEPLTFTINNSIKRPFNVQLIASQVHIALLACISDALNWPDSGLAVGMLTGFPVVGIIPDSGVYRPTQPALPPPRFNDDFMEFTDSNDSWNRHLEYRLRAQAAGSTRAPPSAVESAQSGYVSDPSFDGVPPPGSIGHAFVQALVNATGHVKDMLVAIPPSAVGPTTSSCLTLSTTPRKRRSTKVSSAPLCPDTSLTNYSVLANGEPCQDLESDKARR